ncbi:phage tail sheath family protein [Paenibacillus sp. NEAU-GSW1]|uniref:phage tail sheath family protein n=1 Tax=Paenibacillus sp. NEAU-GSW1 TaxID=2682486 RepID=UPI0012E22C15|nr:phage tail sheath family protein [Paenibacillus sp. NEAU-GSW1]MUT67830.1 phage tail sheath protein [Paenibacillus sp. NEAU-GSW1]
MAGGTWTTQNKVRPGVYINFTVERKQQSALGERGIVSVPLVLGWGAPNTIVSIQAGSDMKSLLGYDLNTPEMLLVKEALKRAKTLLLYRLNTGTKASAVLGGLTATAKFGGERGNAIQITIQQNVDDEQLFDVATYLAGEKVDLQTVEDIAALISNAYVDFSGTGALSATAGISLSGGANGSVTNQQHADYLEAIELHEFNTIALPSNDASLKPVYAAFARRLREEEGRKIQVVLANYPSANHEGVISVKNGVKLADGTAVHAEQAVVWVAAATAGAGISESLTYSVYEDAVDTDIRYTGSQIEQALQNGEFVFSPSRGGAIVEQDINSLTDYGTGKSRSFSKNRVVRVLDGIANDLKSLFETSYIGKIDNNADGRSLFRSEVVKYLEQLQSRNAIQNFDSQADLTVAAGEESDAIVIEVHIQPVDSVEKVYMKVTVK